jgi:hypothetical protein
MSKVSKLDKYIIQILSKEFGENYKVKKNEFDRSEVLYKDKWVCGLDEIQSVEIFENKVIVRPVYLFNTREDGYGDLVDSIVLTDLGPDYYIANRFIA